MNVNDKRGDYLLEASAFGLMAAAIVWLMQSSWQTRGILPTDLGTLLDLGALTVVVYMFLRSVRSVLTSGGRRGPE